MLGAVAGVRGEVVAGPAHLTTAKEDVINREASLKKFPDTYFFITRIR